jgi:hypothetical protein
VGLGLVVGLFVVLGRELGRCKDYDFLGSGLGGCLRVLSYAVEDQAEEWKVRVDWTCTNDLVGGRSHVMYEVAQLSGFSALCIHFLAFVFFCCVFNFCCLNIASLNLQRFCLLFSDCLESQKQSSDVSIRASCLKSTISFTCYKLLHYCLPHQWFVRVILAP